MKHLQRSLCCALRVNLGLVLLAMPSEGGAQTPSSAVQPDSEVLRLPLRATIDLLRDAVAIGTRESLLEALEFNELSPVIEAPGCGSDAADDLEAGVTCLVAQAGDVAALMLAINDALDRQVVRRAADRVWAGKNLTIVIGSDGTIHALTWRVAASQSN
ncbi:MAG: hypothetical protein AAFZ01_04755 [Pseudomonadota bacterium]